MKLSCSVHIQSDKLVALFARAWIEIRECTRLLSVSYPSPSSRGRGLKYTGKDSGKIDLGSPSSRGRGLKYLKSRRYKLQQVALFARAWIEIHIWVAKFGGSKVALFARAWIEISMCGC